MKTHEYHKLPSRVLDLGPPEGDEEPRLVETAGYPEGNWAALSHCWGGPQHHPLKTTRKNLSRHMNGIPISSLPKTFLDAIIITKTLRLRYLWIDSLCIIQDDENDWLAESKNMGVLYERAVITLAASSAPNSTHGLFLERPYYDLEIPSVQLPFVRKDAINGVQELLGHYSVGIEWRQEPFMTQIDPMATLLSTRGWATQEWILSRRTVHFTYQGMVWVCQRCAEDETGKRIIGRGLPEADWTPEWGRIIQEHSHRDFTYERDRLVSLEAMAREIGKTKTYKDTYCFGMWMSDVPEHLLWSPLVRGKRRTICPSWSWPSSHGPVWFRFRSFDSGRQDETLMSCCKVLEVDEKGGTLIISAKKVEIQHFLLKKMEKTEKTDQAGSWYRTPLHEGYSIGLPNDPPSGWVEFDDGLDVDGSEPIFFLHLATIDYWIDPKLEQYGILIVRDPVQEEVYNRVGIGTTWDPSWMEDASKVSTRII